MNETGVAGRYARALYLLLERQGGGRDALVARLDAARQDVDALAVLVRPGSRLGGFLGSPRVRPQDKRDVLRKGLEGRASREVTVFADLLLRKKRLGVIDAIAAEFATLVERARGLDRAEVVSAVPLTDAEAARLLAELERTTGHRIVLARTVDPSLLGGAYVRIGDHVIDRSAKTLLESIAQKLYETSV